MTADEYTGAILSPCTFYRYRLWRRWNLHLPTLMWVMLNPSTADAYFNDATILAIIDISTRLGYGGIDVANLYAYRTKSPAVLKAAGFPIGEENDKYIRALASNRPGGDVICAWGSHAQPERAQQVHDIITDAGAMPCCLAENKNGSPKHPLYVKRDTRPTFWGFGA